MSIRGNSRDSWSVWNRGIINKKFSVYASMKDRLSIFEEVFCLCKHVKSELHISEEISCLCKFE